MKKLMVMLAAVAMAACAQAATTSWSFSTANTVLKAGYTGEGSSSAIMSNTTVYCLFAEGVTDSSDVSAQNALLNGLRNGSIKASDIATMAVASAVTDAAGKITSDNAVTFTMTSVDVGAKAVFYEVVFSPDNDFIYLSQTSKNASPEGETASIILGSTLSTDLRDADGTAEHVPYSAGWYAVPEPTSGLLLLLGMAGLALKRKVA